MKKISFIIFLACAISMQLQAQVITQLGQWSNNANFAVEYYQDKVITSTTSGIKFIDVSNPSNPVTTTTLASPNNFPMAITVDGSYAFFGGGMTGYFMIADISSINSPVQVGITYDINGTAYQIAVKGNYAFMPTSYDTLYAIDISNKSLPIVIDRIGMGNFSSGVAIKGNYAYIGTAGGLKVVDISNPSNLNVLSNMNGVYSEVLADLPNNRLFVAKPNQGFDVVDITNPASPSILFQGSGGNSGGDLVYKNGFVFQVGSADVSAFQIGVSSATYLTSFNSTVSGQVNAICAKDSVFYLSTVNNLHVLKLSYLTGMEDNSPLETAIFYLNPAEGVISLKFTSSPPSNIKLYDIMGKLVKQFNSNFSKNLQIGIADLNSGIYFVSFDESYLERRIKFVKR